MQANTPETFMLNVLPDGDNWEEAKYEVYYKGGLKSKGMAGDILSLRVPIGSIDAYHSNIAPSDENYQDMLDEEGEVILTLRQAYKTFNRTLDKDLMDVLKSIIEANGVRTDGNVIGFFRDKMKSD